MFNINHVAISAKNLKETIEFYKKFGFEEKKEYTAENVDIVCLKLDNTVLEIFHYPNNEELPEYSKELGIDLRTVGNKHFGLGVKNINEGKEFVEKNKLNDKEIVIHEGRLGKPYFFIKDPNGILMEIIEED